MSDLIPRQAAIEEVETRLKAAYVWYDNSVLKDDYALSVKAEGAISALIECVLMLKGLPSAEPTLYGYKIEHLAYIARVMEKEGVTADYAVRTFDDMSRVIKMIIDEIQQKVEEALNERSNQKTVGDRRN